MTKLTEARKKPTSGHLHKAAVTKGKDGFEIESFLPAGSPQRTTAEIVTAAGGALIAAALLGVGPAALAGAAGYLVYRETHR
jgi:hypothetical protein